jgi:hypothetical protein
MRFYPELIIATIFTLTSCSSPKEPTKIVDIGSSNVAFFMNIPGGTLDDYISIDVTESQHRRTLVSVSTCDMAAARSSGSTVEVVLFNADFSGFSTPNPAGKDVSRSLISDSVKVNNIFKSPKAVDIATLKRDGYTLIKCK